MKPTSLILTLLLTLFLLSACTPRNEWTTYSVSEFLEKEPFLPYSFEYPSDWAFLDEGSNHIALASDKKLFKDVPDKLKPGQIIVKLSMNITMPPDEMVEIRADGMRDVFRFNDVVSFELNGRSAAYIEGSELEMNDQAFFIAVDIGENMRGLLVSYMADGELETWRETLMRMAKSLRIDS
jgi:hypothetical protein